MKKVLLTISCVLFASTVVFGHWYEGDPHKMHYAQMPDPFGWDINMTNFFTLADDWQCMQSGPVEDIHFWYSVEMGDHLMPPHFQTVTVSIHDDVPVGPDNLLGYSYPGLQRWSATFTVAASMINGPWDGDQGWDDPTPFSGVTPCRYQDHRLYWQLNITNIDDPFIQEEGKIYWLDLNVAGLADPYHHVGWKTTLDPFLDTAVYQVPVFPGWAPIQVCTENRVTDLAFVITPEPATMMLLGVGSFALLRRRRA